MEFLRQMLKFINKGNHKHKSKRQHQAQMPSQIIKSDSHQYLTHQQIKHIRDQLHQINHKLINSSQTLRYGNQVPELVTPEQKKILFLDLDQTIIFYSQSKGFHVRPHLNNFLRNISDQFEVYIFTAAQRKYAQMVIQNLGEARTWIKGIFSREHCTVIIDETGNCFAIKQLNIFRNCMSQKMVLVDDNPHSYVFNLSNAIPIKPYEGEFKDAQLSKLQKVLKRACKFEDVRMFIQESFIKIEGDKA